MTVIAEFSAPISEFPLGVALTEAGLDRVEFERVVPVEGDPLPLFWVWGDDVVSFVAEATAQPAVASVSLVSEVDDGALCRADWDASSSGVVSAVQEAGPSSTRRASATAGGSGSGRRSGRRSERSSAPASGRTSPSN